MARSRRIGLGVLALLISIGMAESASAESADDRARREFEAMTPAQRVGQLFLVAFCTPSCRDDDPAPLADAQHFVRDLGVGGIVLQSGNHVFGNVRGNHLPSQVAGLTAELQNSALGEGGPGVPLFVAVDHEGDGEPFSHLREGFTALPSPMAIGATWDPERARTVGRIAGEELGAVGVNLLFGPVLDVLADPRVDTGGDIGTRAFGGDPFWVGRLGQAYVAGVHEGSSGRVATVAKHFPGHGGSDRLPDQEVATVNKSLFDLRRIELAPFAAVTANGAARDPSGMTDALMTSHIRYRGFQGNYYRVTPPISLDAEALGAILTGNGSPFSSWRADGGLIVSDSLGVRALKRYMDPSGATFRHREVARRALEAGNDLLILAQFATTPAWSAQRANIEDTLAYFVASYESDAAFRARVDDAVGRILRHKAALYPSWKAVDVAVDPAKVDAVVGTARSRAVVEDTAARAVTTLQLRARPAAGENLVVITDDLHRLACPRESCGLDARRVEALGALGPTLLEAMILDRYGPSGTGILGEANIESLSFCQLRRALAPATAEPVATADPSASTVAEPGPTPAPASGPGSSGAGCEDSRSPTAVVTMLSRSDWVIFAFADLPPGDIRDLTGFLLPQVAHIAQDQGEAHLAVMSFGPPYYVDQTNLARLDASIAAYSKIPASMDAAVRTLFGELPPGGAAPVSIEDAGYDLTSQLAPDPDRPFTLERTDDAAIDFGAAPPKVGVQTTQVLDHNGHPVPDGTIVEFYADPVDALGGRGKHVVPTRDGVARTELVLVHGGDVTIHAQSGQSSAQTPLTLALPNPTATPSPTPVASLSPSTLPTADARPADPLGAVDFLLALAAVVVVGGGGSLTRLWPARTLDDRVRTALLVLVGGLAGYLVYGWVVVVVVSAAPVWSSPIAAAMAAGLGALLGLVGGYLWARVTVARSMPRPTGTS